MRIEEDNMIYNLYNKLYKINNDIEKISYYLKEKYFIDLTNNSISKKRIRDKIAIKIAILRDIEINRKAEKERRKKIIDLDLNKSTLKYLYLQ